MTGTATPIPPATPVAAQPPAGFARPVRNWIRARRLLLGGIGCAFALVIAVRTLHSGNGAFERAEKLLVEIRQMDARWTVEVLSLELGQMGNYDAITRPVPWLRTAFIQLSEVTRDLPISGIERDRLQSLSRTADSGIAGKTELVERALSQYAILNNSLRFLPTASRDLLQAINSADLSVEKKADAGALLASLLSDTMASFNRDDGAARGRIEATRHALQALVAPVASLTPQAEALFTHTDITVQQRRVGSELLDRIVRLPTTATIDTLRDAYTQAGAVHLRRESLQDDVAVGFGAILLILLAYLGWQLVIDIRRLKDSNVQLKREHEEAQVQLIQSAKMSGLGQMVAGIAHEINTPLAYVKATFSVLQDLLSAQFPEVCAAQPGEEPVVKEKPSAAFLQDIKVLLEDGFYGVAQISNLITSMKNFSRLDRTTFGDFSLPEILEGALTISNYRVKHVADVVKNFEDVPPIRCTPSQIGQVFLNIVSNAAAAMVDRPTRGTLTITMRMEDPKTVRVDISDNGTGIPSHILPRIFDPFFSTKRVGEGTGLGLSICYEIVRNHGGKLLVASEEGVGTTFSLLLPILGATAEATERKLATA